MRPGHLGHVTATDCTGFVLYRNMNYYFVETDEEFEENTNNATKKLTATLIVVKNSTELIHKVHIGSSFRLCIDELRLR